MKKLFEIADRYLQQCTWKDLTLIKFCLFSMGLLMGSFVAGKHKKTVRYSALAVFLATYIPLMAKFLPMLKAGFEEDTYEIVEAE